MKKVHEVLGVEIVGGLREASTPWAGASLLVELVRRTDVDALADKVLPANRSAKGLKQGQTAESFVLLSALGSESDHAKDIPGFTHPTHYTQLPQASLSPRANRLTAGE